MSFTDERGNEAPPPHPAEQTSLTELQQGIDLDQHDSTPEEELKSEHPTPNHPTGRLTP